MPASVKRVLSPTEWKDRQINNLKATGANSYAVGIASPKANPIEAGIAAEGKFKNKMQKALDGEFRKKGLEKTSMDEWYLYASTLGKDRIVEGVVKREAKVANFLNTWQPLLNDHLNKIDALPDETDVDRENKVIENLRGLRALHGKA